jgi:hypothetical protein
LNAPRHTKGPVVKTGPTRGNNRSRTKDGSWRAKRSDAGKSRKKSGACLITTVACCLKGLPDDCHQLTMLRRFRDERLSKSPRGRALVRRYYELAPSLIQHLTQSNLRPVWRNIVVCVEAVERKRFHWAEREYRRMVSSLQSAHRSADASLGARGGACSAPERPW